MTADDLNAYLHTHIPLSRHLQLQVLDLDEEQLRVRLPLAPNVNPHGTVFGGALTALGLVSAWMLLYVRFQAQGLDVKLVGKQSQCDFLAPAEGDCIAHTRCAAADQRVLFETFSSRGRARQSLDTRIHVGEVEVARHHGVYTALSPLPVSHRKSVA